MTVLDLVKSLAPTTNPLLVLPSLALIYYLSVGYKYHGTTAKLRHIPTVGYEQPILYYWSAIKYLINAQATFDEGSIAAAHTGTFKFAGLLKWVVVVTDLKMMTEIYRTPEDVLSMHEAFEEVIQTSYTFGKNIGENHYHADTLRNRLSKGLNKVAVKVHDEAEAAFRDGIPLTEDWQAVPMMDTVLRVVARISNRVFVGLPLCRNPDYLAINLRFTLDAVKTATLFALVPAFMRPILAMLDNHVQRGVRRGVKHLSPEIAARWKFLSSDKDDGGEQFDDYLTWIMQDAKGEERSDRNLTSRILATNFASIHTSSMTFTQAMYTLAGNQEWMRILRKEADEVIAKYGWTKDAVDELHAIDSFVKETQRTRPLGLIGSRRVALRDWSFSNGTHIPKGTTMATSIRAGHYDAYFNDPHVFDPLRYVKIRAQDSTARVQIVSTSTTSLIFGHGRQACPGRFFASSEIKIMTAYLLINYDFKLESEGVRPPDIWFGETCTPDPKAKLLFRKRRA